MLEKRGRNEELIGRISYLISILQGLNNLARRERERERLRADSHRQTSGRERIIIKTYAEPELVPDQHQREI